MEEKDFYQLLVQRYMAQKLTAEELEVFAHLVQEGKLDEQLLVAMNEAAGIAEADELAFEQSQQKKVRPLWIRIVAAAMLFICLAAGIYSYQRTEKTPVIQASIVKHDAEPGGTKATLTLADGSTISLTDAGNGELAEQAGVKITKSAQGQLIYTLTDQSAKALAYNTITTPKGGEYQVNLPDGTKVWLNAASSIKFPTTFVNAGNRKVELKGEAYFEVAKSKDQPFLVSTSRQEIVVLGTHFNINAYEDESETMTTLLEGSLRVSAAGQVLLKPGQQVKTSNTGKAELKVQQANIAQTMAWKNGYFHFENENLYTVMRQLARWYDVDIVYENARSDDEFVGDIPRKVKLSAVIKILEYTGTRFRIENKKLIVSR